MLITDDTEGQRGLRESQHLGGLLRVGNEFMTHSDDGSEVQRSGEFARFTAEEEDEVLKTRFLLLHETADVYGSDGDVLDSSGFYNLAPGARTLPRTKLFASELDIVGGRDKPFKPLRVPLDMVRMPRYTWTRTGARLLGWNIYEYCYTAITGKRRVFPQENGKLLVVRDVIERGGRFFYGNDAGSFSRRRSTRVSRVDVVEVDLDRKSVSAPALSFPVFSGLGADVTGRVLNTSGPNDGMQITDATYVYGKTAGAMWGKDLWTTGPNLVPMGGDAGDLYAVCEPALAHTGSGRSTYKSFIAVYAADDDVHDVNSAGPYRLTCKRSLVTGGFSVEKINFPATANPALYLGASGITLLRTGPTTAVLRVRTSVMQASAPSPLQSIAANSLFFWTQDNGATWTLTPPTVVGFPDAHPYGGVLVKDETTLIVFSEPSQIPSGATTVWSVTPGAASQVGTVAAATFNDGLAAGFYRPPYMAFGFGGVVYRKTLTGTTKRLWMQFDPRYGYAPGPADVLDYPSSRPMLLVSDDGGVTWQRRFLPTPWSFLVGFVVSLDETGLAVPVYARRASESDALETTIYVSRDGGDNWAATGARASLPHETVVDGSIVAGDAREAISDCWLQYNRGELHPMLVVNDKKGRAQGSNPARPWMVNANVEAPSYG